MKIIRWTLGKVILFLDWVTTPKSIQRDPEAQKILDDHMQSWALYQFQACPFCVKVRRFMKKQNIHVALKDAKTDSYRSELLQGGGKVKVPCLRFEQDGQVQWMYESNDIIGFLDQQAKRA